MTARAPFACDPAASRGRLIAEPESTSRSPFQRDRDRIIHSAAFRRLKHKTQVFVYHEGDHYRTRLTHSLEVSQIARSLARSLGLDEDLAEALALAHDLGHPPFGHTGEEVLNGRMADYEGFDHNVQAFRLVTKLEGRYATFDGLNLTWETLEGLIKHNGPLPAAVHAKYQVDAPPGSNPAFADLQLKSYASLEAQIASLSDDIAYNSHDLDDGMRAGLLSVEDVERAPMVGEVFASVRELYPGIELERLIHEGLRRLISLMVEDVSAVTGRRLAELAPGCADDVRACGRPVAAFSEEVAANVTALKAFLKQHMYRHYKVNRMMVKAARVVGDLFDAFIAKPDILPGSWYAACEGPHNPKTARVICDYIAGMTDRFALQEHRRLFAVDNWN